MKKTLSVPAINEGTVIDHIPAGSALIIIQLLNVQQYKNKTTIGLNLSSQSMGEKDIIKIENRYLTDKEAQEIAIFAPQATINIIKDYKIEKKIKTHLPEIVESILVCPNKCCVTHILPNHSAFLVEEFKNKIYLRCKYCEKVFERQEIKEYSV
jgi:aspartate carbamoyltransferase regulatory subunit